MTLATDNASYQATAARPLTTGLKDLLYRFAALLMWGFAVARQRRRLLALDDDLLKDIGLSRADAEKEGRRGFWDLPDHSKRG